MNTICVQIGNSDKKLIQYQWTIFMDATDAAIKNFCYEVHFSGKSDYFKPWQNACWVFEIKEEKKELLKQDLKRLREIFKQDSIAWMEGTVEFV